MTIEAPITVDMRALGFLGRYPGREYRVFAAPSAPEKLTIQIGALRASSDDVIEAAQSTGIRFETAFDDAHPDFVVLEATGAEEAVEGLSRRVAQSGYHMIYDRPVAADEPYDLTRGGDGLEALPDFLTEEDVARVLRRSVQTIQRYRLDAGLPYLAGRPPIIMKSDLLEFLKQFRTVRPVYSDWKKEYRSIVPYGKGVDDDQGKLVREARERALRMKLKPIRRRPKPTA